MTDTPERKRQTGRATREALLAALGEVFESQGYDGATLTQLSAATGLGKASLYHHFPGGKSEMAAALLRDRVASLEREAFSRLKSNLPPADKLAEFIDGFRAYVRDGERACLIQIFGQGTAGAEHGETIARQYTDWLGRLAATFEEAGFKPKRARRAAAELMASLYGYLITARMAGDSGAFRRQAKRLKQTLG
jgi:AcrR family transcriptional regulator